MRIINSAPLGILVLCAQPPDSDQPAGQGADDPSSFHVHFANRIATKIMTSLRPGSVPSPAPASGQEQE